MTLDDKLDHAEKFHEEFRALVRKYAPTMDDIELLAMMQDRTSIYNPFIWSNQEENSNAG